MPARNGDLVAAMGDRLYRLHPIAPPIGLAALLRTEQRTCRRRGPYPLAQPLVSPGEAGQQGFHGTEGAIGLADAVALSRRPVWPDYAILARRVWPGLCRLGSAKPQGKRCRQPDKRPQRKPGAQCRIWPRKVLVRSFCGLEKN